MRGGFQASIAADRQFPEGILEPLSVTLLLSRGFFGLTLAVILLIGGAGDRGEIIEIGA